MGPVLMALGVLVGCVMLEAGATPQVTIQPGPDVLQPQLRPSVRTATERRWFSTGVRTLHRAGTAGEELVTVRTLVAYGVTLRDMLAFSSATDKLQFGKAQVVDGPEWVYTSRFDLELPVMPDAGTPVVYDSDEIAIGGSALPLLRRFLEEKFGLRAHLDRRQLVVYDLVKVANGPDLKLSKATCTASDPTTRCQFKAGPGSITAQGRTMRYLANQMSWNFPGILELVRDRTGLSGNYDYTFSYSPSILKAPDRKTVFVENPAAGAGPSLAQAMEERLGIRMQQGADTVDVIVIDDVRPLITN